MIEEIKSILSQIAKAKVAAIVVLIFIVGAVVYSNLNVVEGISLNLHLNSQKTTSTNSPPPSPKTSSGDQKNVPIPSLRIVDVHTTPVRFKASNYLYFRVMNNGSADAHNVKVTIDLGTSSATAREVRQEQTCSFKGEESTSIQSLQCPILSESAYIDVILTLKEPTFSNIKANADNSSYTYTYNISDHHNENDNTNGMIAFFKIIGGIVVSVVTILLLFKFIGFLFPGKF